jgi:hypothetical protein
MTVLRGEFSGSRQYQPQSMAGVPKPKVFRERWLSLAGRTEDTCQNENGGSLAAAPRALRKSVSVIYVCGVALQMRPRGQCQTCQE